MGICVVCNQQFVKRTKNQVYCSHTCGRIRGRENDRKKRPPATPVYPKPRVCVRCGVDFMARSSNHLFCTVDCRLSCDRYLPQKNWVASPVKCSTCDKDFMPNVHNTKYCSATCREKWYKDQYEKNKKTKTIRYVSCLRCGTVIETSYCDKYCSIDCRDTVYAEIRSQEREEKERKERSKLVKLEAALLPQRERDFAEWFKFHYYLFGIRSLLNISTPFPDVTAEMVDGRILKIELEYFAHNFVEHGHDPSGCDLIICYAKKTGADSIAGIPVVALFDVMPSCISRSVYFDQRYKNPSKFLRRLMDVGASFVSDLFTPEKPDETD